MIPKQAHWCENCGKKQKRHMFNGKRGNAGWVCCNCGIKPDNTYISEEQLETIKLQIKSKIKVRAYLYHAHSTSI
jgi:hypothetical protein